MIKVNLLQGRTGTAATGQAPMEATSTEVLGGTAATISKALQGENSKRSITNLLIILSIPAAIIIYERQNLETLKRDSVTQAGKVKTIEKKVTEKKAEIGKYAGLAEKAKELNDKLDIIRKLSRIRLREIKALDFIQSTVPEKVWLNSLSVRDGLLAIHGYAVTDDDLTLFVRGLEKSRNFSNILLLQAKEERTKEGTVKSFEVSGIVEAE